MRTTEVARFIEDSMRIYRCALRAIAWLELDSDQGVLSELCIVNIGPLSYVPDEFQLPESQDLDYEVKRQVILALPDPDPYATLTYRFGTGEFNLEFEEDADEQREEAIERILALIPTTHLETVIARHQEVLLEMTKTVPEDWERFHR